MSPRQRRRKGPPERTPQQWTRPAIFTAVAAAILAAAPLIWREAVKSRPQGRRPNVLLITVDTLRADHLGCYGLAGAGSPVLDDLAARGVRFATAIAHAPMTAPSHASILTSLTPPRHGVRDNGRFALPQSVPTLAESFQKGGYRTAAFVSGFPLDRRFGLARGFDLYDDRLPHGNDPRRAPYVERTADGTTRVALEWLRRAPQPWFAWVHYFDPHAPYEPPPEIEARFRGRPYDGEIAFVDRELGELFLGAGVSEPGANSLVLVTADHGESLGEHGEDTHGIFVYDATLRVPWIVAGPNVPKGRVSRVIARGVDVGPTLLDYSGLPALAGAEGRSLRRAASGEAVPDAPAYVESLFAQLNLGWAPLHGWRTEAWKLVDAPRPELYAVDVDARETHDLASEHQDVLASLRRPLREALARKAPEAFLAGRGEVAERLRALGYLGGDAPAAPSLRDPKEGIDLIRRLERGLAEARTNPSLAVGELTAVLQEDPRQALALRYRAMAFQVAGRHEAAMADMATLARQGPLGLEDLVLLAETQRLARKPAQALATLDRADTLDPRAPEPSLIRARVLRSMRRPTDARVSLERALAAVPGQIEALRGLAELDLEEGALASAGTRLEAIVANDAGDVGALVRLGVVRVRTGHLDEALSLFQRGVALAPHDAEALLDLAGALAKAGRPAEAVPLFERAIEAGGPTSVALNGLGFARLESGDTAGALKALRQSLSLEPRQPRVTGAVAQLAGGRKP